MRGIQIVVVTLCIWFVHPATFSIAPSYFGPTSSYGSAYSYGGYQSQAQSQTQTQPQPQMYSFPSQKDLIENYFAGFDSNFFKSSDPGVGGNSVVGKANQLRGTNTRITGSNKNAIAKDTKDRKSTRLNSSHRL